MILLAFAACTPETVTDDSGVDAVDVRLTEDDLPAAGENDATWWGADTVIPAGADQLWCTLGTYDGPDMGIHANVTYQGQFGHHFVLMGTTVSEIDQPDGTTFECTDSSSYMVDAEPIAIPTEAFVNGERLENDLALPDGMAVKLNQGQRYILQSHYLNTGSEAIRVQDAIRLELLDPDTEVETWAAPLVFNSDDWELTPQSATSASFDCELDTTTPWSVAYMLPHMHEWGTSISISRVVGDAEETIVEVPTWDPYYRDAAPTTKYEPGELTFQDGDVIRTSCNWFNDTDEPIVFPHEMCVGVGLIYPQLTTVICDDEG